MWSFGSVEEFLDVCGDDGNVVVVVDFGVGFVG